jgi:predicted RNA-binding Zn-ribbon protein involved in translation (DUF1610 family)
MGVTTVICSQCGQDMLRLHDYNFYCPNCINKKWYPVVINKLNNFTEILYNCPYTRKEDALSFPETITYSSAIDAIP